MEKPMIKNITKFSIRVALVAAVAFPLIIAMSARAQEPAPTAPPTGSNIAPTGAPAATEATAERVVVTGSNIPTAEEVGPNPVDTYRRDDITRLGVRTPTDLVLRIPAATGSQTTENNTNGGDGSTRISLRGIDPKETLVLQDGRRLAAAGTSSIDFNRFPLGLIDHIDILKDGASPIYGTEAVAGVVNVFLIHRFRGLEVYASYGNTNLGFANDRGEETGYLLAGTGDDKTNIVVYAGIYNASAIYSRDSDISHDADYNLFGGADARSGNFPGRITPRQFLGTAQQPFKSAIGGLRSPTPHAAANQFTDTQYTNRGLTSTSAITSERAFFNFADLTPSIAATDREYLYGSFDPFTTADYTSNGGFSTSFPAFSQQSAAPPGTEFTTGVRYRSLEAGLRTLKERTDNYLFTGGLKGNLGEFANAWDQLKTWEWEAGIRYNESCETIRTGGLINNYALRNRLLDTDPATAFNPFGISQNSRQVKNEVFVTSHEITDSVLLTEDFTLRGDLFNLPGGAVRFAIGGMHLGNTVFDDPDSLTKAGQTTGATNFQPTRGSRDTWSIFEEVRVPVTGPTWNFPGAYSLEFGFAEREEWYSDFGDTQRPKFDVRWQPIDQSLTLRAAYIEAFHAPTLGELFGGTGQTFPIIVDPFTVEPQVEQHIFGNPHLKPEIAYEYTYGGVLTPGKWWAPLQGLTLSADFIHIDIRGFTTTIDPQFLIDHAGPQDPVTGTQTLGASTITRDGFNGPILLLFTPEQNLGREILSAWDFEAVEIFDTSRLGHGDWGTFTATWNETYMADVDIQAVPNGKRQTVVGKFGGGFQGVNGGGSFTHNRWYASLFYDGPSGSWMQGIDAGAVVHFVGQYWDNAKFTFYDARTRPGFAPDLFGNCTGLSRLLVDFVPDTTIPAVFPNANGKGGNIPGYTFVPCQGTFDRKVREFVTLDLIVNYTFNLPPPAAQNEVAGYAKDGGKNVKMKDGKEKNVMPVSTAEYNPCGWRSWLNNVTFTVGVDNVTDEQPPFVAAAFENGYDQQTANNKGRLWFVGIKKRF